jgi:cyclohexanone monooxygenase
MATEKLLPAVDVVVVGAGFAGLYMLHRLRALGLTVQVYEAGADVGGTWFWNRYPGARCDVESMEYSYSFSDELQQEWAWTERYATQPEILRYVNHVADRFDLRRSVQFNTRVGSAVFDEDRAQWTITTDDKAAVTAKFCVMATGCLSAARVPDMAGLSGFKGNWYHSGLWPQEGVDFSGKVVGVIGTGSSGIQLIPEVAKQAAKLYVFQRTPTFSLPAGNRPLQPDAVLETKKNYPELRQRARVSPAGVASYPVPTRSALDATAQEREADYEVRWQAGGTAYTRTYNDVMLSVAANETAADFARRKTAARVHDPVVADALLPKEVLIGTKRLCLDDNYFETFNQEHVTLVDLRKAPIQDITPEGVRTSQAHYKVDALIFATGFDAMTGALLKIDIRTSSGRTLAQSWSAGPRTYLGLMTAGFPNLFTITGPGSPSVISNVMVSIEQHVEWISDCLHFMREAGHSHIEAELSAQDAWVAHVNEVANATLYPQGNSWYVGANIPGKPRVFMPYVGGVGRYRQKCTEVAAKGYEGFRLSPAKPGSASP